MVWREGLEEWQKAEWVEELKPILFTAPPPIRKPGQNHSPRKADVRLFTIIVLVGMAGIAFFTNPSAGRTLLK